MVDRRIFVINEIRVPINSLQSVRDTKFEADVELNPFQERWLPYALGFQYGFLYGVLKE